MVAGNYGLIPPNVRKKLYDDENVNYGRDELMVLIMVRQGLFGDLLHGEAAYIHELRWQMKEIEHKTGSWRTNEHTEHNENLYPTHGTTVPYVERIKLGIAFDTSLMSRKL
ncbi:hypothetical protein ND16A_0313 [Thalassotalea sp. ND16A]|nr:hypothetical protein ND16A_0313 [Thalassotalea sp. ND16A]